MGGNGEEAEMRTWPPEKPTATTPSSLPRVRNLGLTMLVVVIVAIAREDQTPQSLSSSRRLLFEYSICF